MHTVIPSDFIPFNFADKTRLISYLNEEHFDELRNFAVALLPVEKRSLHTVVLQDIGKTGLLLEVTQLYQSHLYFLPFSQPLNHPDDFQQQYLVLVQQSANKLGKTSIELKNRHFTLQDKYTLTPHIVRLVLQSEQNLSALPAGYAFLFKMQLEDMSSSTRAVRYYTLRKAWRNQDNPPTSQSLAWIDIYYHGDINHEISLGEMWVNHLTIGDNVVTEREFPEKIDHLSTGQALLIADETSLPTLARLLETWQNPLAPVIITFLQSEAELPYLTEVLKHDNPHAIITTPTILPIIADSTQLPHEQIFNTLSDFLTTTPLTIHKVWGGLEANTTKKLRPLLLDYLQLTRETMVIKVYWRKDECI